MAALIARILRGKKVKAFIAAKKQLGDDDAVLLCKSIRDSLHLTSLTQLVLHHNNIGNIGATECAKLLPLAPLLAVVNVASNRIGEAGLLCLVHAALGEQAQATIRACSSLTALNIDDNLATLPEEVMVRLQEHFLLRRNDATKLKIQRKQKTAAEAGVECAVPALCREDVHIAIIGGGIGGLVSGFWCGVQRGKPDGKRSFACNSLRGTLGCQELANQGLMIFSLFSLTHNGLVVVVVMVMLLSAATTADAVRTAVVCCSGACNRSQGEASVLS
jgi:hypothetical protein